jgi:hypothetical protein
MPAKGFMKFFPKMSGLVPSTGHISQIAGMAFSNDSQNLYCSGINIITYNISFNSSVV